ncbi:membrane protein insertase YidC [Desulfonatronovibrio magnus]|uniref:membrane protein insertase YidC n=1 Tax=Desulfonatronovibrio magnus TaxID=698827 RepID=UPI0005EB7C31|nr:membrane protein insertase YidC [Desulfonatronovibrio magnus]
MEIHRVLIAVVLSLVVLVIWNVLFPPAPPQQRAPESQEQVQEMPSTADEYRPDSAAPQDFVPPEFPEFEAIEGKQITVQTPLFEATFNSSGGVLEHFVLRQFRQSIEPDAPYIDLITPRSLMRGPMGVSWNRVPTWIEGEWTFDGEDLFLGDSDEKSLTFTGRIGGVNIIRTYTFRGDSYEIQEELEIVNSTEAQVAGEISNILATPAFSGDRYNPTRVAYFDQSGLSHEKDKQLREGFVHQNGLKWSAIGNHYFLLAFVPHNDRETVLRAELENEIYRIAVSETLYIEPGMVRSMANTYYIGPKDRDYLIDAPAELHRAIYYGWFNVIAKPLIISLNFFHSHTGNYGVAILLLTLVIKIIFWPLAQKSYKSMNQLKKLQPMMAKIREKYKDDRQKMNEEMMRLYKTYKVNPAGGCLPILVQIPVFIALYQGLMGAVELRHATFIEYLPFTDIVWLADLSARDPFYITPLVMGATMFLQQKMAPPPGDPLQAKIMLFLPLVFIFIFITFPSGLVLYWLANNVLSIGQQWWVLRSAGNKPLVKADGKDEPEEVKEVKEVEKSKPTKPSGSAKQGKKRKRK